MQSITLITMNIHYQRTTRIPVLLYCAVFGFMFSEITGVRAQSIAWKRSAIEPEASFRGLAIVDEQTAWACGSKGIVVKSLDAGQTWRECSPAGHESLEFRCIHSFSAEVACIASAGTPAILLRTVDGGTSWAEAYRHESPKAFFDAMVFWNQNQGLAVSDPIDGRWLILSTTDGGRSWAELMRERLPRALEREAAFAASNGSLFLLDEKQWWLGTGGATGESGATVLAWNSGDAQWRRTQLPMPSGESSGVFAIDFSRFPTGVAVGGDYKQDSITAGTAAWTDDGGVTWHAPEHPPSGYRSSVVYWTPSNGPGIYVAVGPTGTDLSTDGKRWTRASEHGFHTVRSTRLGKLWGVGAAGRLGTAEGVNQ